MEHLQTEIKTNNITAPAPLLETFPTNQFLGPIQDGNSGATMDLSCWTPNYANGIPAGYYFLGSYASQGDETPGNQILYKAINDDPKQPYFAAPTGFNCVWSKSHCGLQVYSMYAPDGYVAVGCIVTGDNNPPSTYNVPYFNNLMCIRTDLCAQITAENLVWNDHGSGAELSASVFLLPVSQTAVAFYDYPDAPQTMDVNPAILKS